MGNGGNKVDRMVVHRRHSPNENRKEEQNLTSHQALQISWSCPYVIRRLGFPQDVCQLARGGQSHRVVIN